MDSTLNRDINTSDVVRVKTNYLFHPRVVKTLQPAPSHSNTRNISHPSQDKDSRFGKNMSQCREPKEHDDNKDGGHRTDNHRAAMRTSHKANKAGAKRTNGPSHQHKVKKN